MAQTVNLNPRNSRYLEAAISRIQPALGRAIFPLGLACNKGIDALGLCKALDTEIDYVYWTSGSRGAIGPIREALKRERDRYIFATGPTTGWFGVSVRRFVEAALKRFEIETIDVLQLHWMGITAAWTDGTREALEALKASGKVRAIGISIHDRQRAGLLAQQSPLDLFMLRYNAAHPGAERDVFPHKNADKHTFIAYTATRWGKLLRRPRGWDEPLPRPSDLYRFCLSDPHVDAVLCGPSSFEQLQENLAAVARGPLDEETLTAIRRFGAVVHG